MTEDDFLQDKDAEVEYELFEQRRLVEDEMRAWAGQGTKHFRAKPEGSR